MTLYPSGGRKFVARITDSTGQSAPGAPFTIESVAAPTLVMLTGTLALPENASAGTVAGPLVGITSGSTLSLVNDAGGRVEISGGQIRLGGAPIDYETAPTVGPGRGYTFTVRETLVGATNGPFLDSDLTLYVTDVSEGGGVAVATIRPSTPWNTSKAAGSGWAAGAEPVLTKTYAAPTANTPGSWDGTNRPAIKEFFGDHVRFTNTWRVYVIAGANRADGTMGEALGISKVVFHYEGSNVEVGAPAFHTYVDVNGITKVIFGWVIDLVRTGDGSARLWATAHAVDPAKQPRTIGPFIYYPSSGSIPSLDIAATPDEQQGVRYKTFDAAMQWAQQQSWQTYILNVIEGNAADNPYILNDVGTPSLHNNAGRCIIQGTVPFFCGGTPGKSYPEFTGAYTVDYRPGVSITHVRAKRIEFRGANCNFDQRWLKEFNARHDVFWNGAKLVNTAGRGQRWAGGPHKSRKLVESPNNIARTALQYQQDCSFQYVNDPAKEVQSCVNNHLSEGTEDTFTGTGLIYGNTIDVWGKEVHNYQPAFDFYYDGAGEPYIEWVPSTVGMYRDVVLKVDSGSGPVEVARYGILTGEANFLVNNAPRTGNYQVKHIVDWMNSLPRVSGAGWKANLLDNSTRAAQLSRAVRGGDGSVLGGNQGAGQPFGVGTNYPVTLPVSKISGSPTMIYTYIDAHSDFMAMQGRNENQITMNNRLIESYGQIIYWLGNSGGAHDYMYVNNLIDGREYTLPGTSVLYLLNSPFQQIKVPARHLMFHHNTYAGHENTVTNSVDPASSYSNNAIPKLEWSVSGQAKVDSNHSMSPHKDPQANHTNFSSGGTRTGTAKIFVDADGKDFTPTGKLIETANLKIPSVPFDINHNLRNMAGDAAGALRIP